MVHLQAPLFTSLPAVASFGSDLWPSLSSALSTPRKLLRHRRRNDTQPIQHLAQSRQEQILGPSPVSHRVELPDCLQTVSMAALRTSSVMSTTASLGTSFLPSTRRSIWTLGASPRMQGPAPASRSKNVAHMQTPLARLFGGAPGRGSGLPKQQQRTFSTTFRANAPELPGSRNQLAHTERTANNNPTSATAQSAFYTALLRANMPKIIIERYQTGRYASNAAADATYLKALQMTGSIASPGMANSVSFSGQQQGSVSQEKLQAVGQAVAAQTLGGQVGHVSGKNSSGSGAKDAPLYVVVEESMSAVVFRWVKMLLYAGLVGYFLLVVLTMVVELTGSLRTRVGQNNEVQPQHQTVRFSDVHGCDEAKEELQELVEFLLNPERFSSLGGKIPKGILLVGPPGTGKTLLARAVAGEAGCPVFYMSGSEFDELYVGVGAKRVRDLFAQARNKAPAIIFIDELDAVGGKRNARDPAYAKQTLNQLLTELDGFSPSTGVILIAATNYPESLDKALVRPGRFDRQVVVNLPDVRGRIEILKHHMRNIAVAGDVDASLLARATSGFSGADLENLVNQAAVHAARLKHEKVGPLDFEFAKDKIMMGAETKSRMIRDKDKIMTAYHEAGHCLVNLFTPGSSQLYKMTIVPRGRALGVTHFLPEMDAVSMGYDQFLAQIDVAMGGRAAEEMIYGANKVTSGIAHDVQTATQTAYHLVTQCGFSPKLGNVDLASDYKSLSSETKQEIEQEVREIVEAGRRRADQIIKDKRNELEILKDALIEFETLDRDEIMKLLKGEKLKRIEVELQEKDESANDKSGPKGSSPAVKPKKETSGKGGVGIKLPDVLLPPGTGTRSDPESARVSDR